MAQSVDLDKQEKSRRRNEKRQEKVRVSRKVHG